MPQATRAASVRVALPFRALSPSLAGLPETSPPRAPIGSPGLVRTNHKAAALQPLEPLTLWEQPGHQSNQRIARRAGSIAELAPWGMSPSLAAPTRQPPNSSSNQFRATTPSEVGTSGGAALARGGECSGSRGSWPRGSSSGAGPGPRSAEPVLEDKSESRSPSSRIPTDANRPLWQIGCGNIFSDGSAPEMDSMSSMSSKTYS
mmetsp:Transcript_23294/g.48501  ORF Transcript_23294/g.48501 Transcript_23294/m.48501 type:complete len:204 (-) Transcript_23294:224-835(-)